MNYFKRNLEGSKIFITSLLIMAIFIYNSITRANESYFSRKIRSIWYSDDVLCYWWYRRNSSTTDDLKPFKFSKMYYLSSLLFGLALLGVVIHNLVIMFICITLIGLFSQWARTTNRVYFQHSVKDYEREGIKYRYDGSRYDTSWKFSNELLCRCLWNINNIPHYGCNCQYLSHFLLNTTHFEGGGK